MTNQELYKAGVASNGTGFCGQHGWVASLDSEGNVWCPYCGWVNQVPYRYNSQLNTVEYLYDDDD